MYGIRIQNNDGSFFSSIQCHLFLQDTSFNGIGLPDDVQETTTRTIFTGNLAESLQGTTSYKMIPRVNNITFKSWLRKA